MSPGWQSSALQIASNVVKRTAFALPVFKIERLASVSPTFSDNFCSYFFVFTVIIMLQKYAQKTTVYVVNTLSLG